MTYLFGQVWLWLLLSFLLGSLVTWLVLKLFRKPKVEVTEERISAPARPRAAAGAHRGNGEAAQDRVEVRDSALGALDDQERTSVLRSSADIDPPTGEIPVLTADGPAVESEKDKSAKDGGALSGTLDEPDTVRGFVAPVADVDDTPTWEPGDYEGSARPLADGSAPAEEFTIKGNMDSMLFHTEESSFYSVTTAEVWFRTGDDAERAGFAPWNRVGPRDRGDAEVPAQATAPEPMFLATTTPPYGPGSALPMADGSAPSDEYTVKGNADSMLFHTTDSPYYGRTKAEAWFKTAADAERAGFTAWDRKRTTAT
ncbi:sunset domain-containing protein [Actinokineospora sp.]|uniref:sunset domain-containing protein n=1 Tax=Actinokineospora sp. TaxID=1872133 RepID=UPI004037C77F